MNASCLHRLPKALCYIGPIAFLFFFAGCKTGRGVYLGYHLTVKDGPKTEHTLSSKTVAKVSIVSNPTRETPVITFKLSGTETITQNVVWDQNEIRSEKYVNYDMFNDLFLDIVATASGVGILVEIIFCIFKPKSYFDENPPNSFAYLGESIMAGLIPGLQIMDESGYIFIDKINSAPIKKSEVQTKKVHKIFRDTEIQLNIGNVGSRKVITDSEGYAELNLEQDLHLFRDDQVINITATPLFNSAQIVSVPLRATYKVTDLVEHQPAIVVAGAIAPSAPTQIGQTPQTTVDPTVITDNNAAKMPGNKVGFVIGIDQYKKYPPLRNARADAQAVAQALRDNYGFSRLTELYDTQATRSAILDNVRGLVDSLQGGEDVLIYFSGHGYYDTTLDRGYWVPVDAADEAGYIPNSEIGDYIKAMDRKKAGHVFVIADSCFSGSFLDVTRDARAIGARPAAATGAGALDFLKRLAATPSRQALTSGGNEPVPDGGGEGHSVFAKYLLQSLAQPEYPAFTATELSTWVARKVGFNSDQTPRLGVIK